MYRRLKIYQHRSSVIILLLIISLIIFIRVTDPCKEKKNNNIKKIEPQDDVTLLGDSRAKIILLFILLFEILF